MFVVIVCMVPCIFLCDILVVIDDGVGVLNGLFGLPNDMVVIDGKVRTGA